MQKRILSLVIVVIILWLFFPGCKTAEGKLDIRGKWHFAAVSVFITHTGTFEFEGGSESNGTVSEGDRSGTWTVNNDQINIIITYIDKNAGEARFEYTGTIHSEKSMTGQFIVTYIDLQNQKEGGNWKANR